MVNDRQRIDELLDYMGELIAENAALKAELRLVYGIKDLDEDGVPVGVTNEEGWGDE